MASPSTPQSLALKARTAAPVVRGSWWWSLFPVPDVAALPAGGDHSRVYLVYRTQGGSDRRSRNGMLLVDLPPEGGYETLTPVRGVRGVVLASGYGT